ncbi:MAG TPA: glycosyl hydrolase [Casimicrobiaceae bacterium]|nr:glycosyl hydrolase [Casimicrobiaceae bacterium]
MPLASPTRVPAARGTKLYIATRKGLWTLASDAARDRWTLSVPQFLGHIVHHALADPRNPQSVLAAARTGHLGPTIFRSDDGGRNWTEAKQPPVFKPGTGRTVDHTFWLTPGHASQPGSWYAGTSPQGLFRSDDGGATWSGVDGFNEHPQRAAWCGGDKDGTPDGGKMHSVLVDPRDPAHMLIGMSSGGVFESTSAGADWRPLNRGVRADFLPDPAPEFGHDPHCVRFASGNADRVYQQNHCGLYRLDRPGDTWTDIGGGMPTNVGAVGFPLVVHPRDANTLWVFPMDGTDVWPRTSPGGRPAAFCSRDGGRTWRRQKAGFPPRDAWWTVKRQAMSVDTRDPAGVYIGTTSGEVWGSADEGRMWRCIARHLPQIYAVEAS